MLTDLTNSIFSITKIVISLLLLISCDLQSDEERTAGLQPSIAVVHGTITSGSGTPISDAQIFFNIFDEDDCTTAVPDSMLWNAGNDLTNEQGKYRIKGKYLHISRQKFCAELKIKPPAESDFDSLTVRGNSVEFIHESLTPPVDSIEVNATLQPN